MDLENMQMKSPEPKRRARLVLNKETIKNLRANGFQRNEAAQYPSNYSICSDCCDPDPTEFCDA
jgi:hypothetical protein